LSFGDAVVPLALASAASTSAGAVAVLLPSFDGVSVESTFFGFEVESVTSVVELDADGAFVSVAVVEEPDDEATSFLTNVFANRIVFSWIFIRT
jgi:hypothetical protein